jgi:hypothetical protein
LAGFLVWPLGLRRAGFRRACGAAHSHPPAGPSEAANKGEKAKEKRELQKGFWSCKIVLSGNLHFTLYFPQKEGFKEVTEMPKISVIIEGREKNTVLEALKALLPGQELDIVKMSGEITDRIGDLK